MIELIHFQIIEGVVHVKPIEAAHKAIGTVKNTKKHVVEHKEKVTSYLIGHVNWELVPDNPAEVIETMFELVEWQEMIREDLFHVLEMIGI